MGAKSAATISTVDIKIEIRSTSGGKKRPQNSQVGAESAPAVGKWGQKVPPFMISKGF